MSSSVLGQQLQMVLSDVEIVVPALPEGYELRAFKKSDTASYIELMHLAGFAMWNSEMLDGALRGILPDGLFVIEHESGVLVATAMATHSSSEFHPFGGELGWVAGHPEHSGKGLGVIVCAAVARRHREAGYKRIYLRTDDRRLPAIKVYLKLGYLPFLFAPDMRQRWEAVCESLHWPFTPDIWPSVDFKALPVETDERPNADNVKRYQPRIKWMPKRPHMA
ncbi:MAG: GNAT family N-acetyltransferase, partial [Armatimonadota bacterium]